MHPSQEQPGFDPTVFSVREREVVDLAVLGHTDEQIAHTLDITTSTVNSYWVRIRGKIGPLSRTEIVAKMLHAGYHEEHARMEAEIARLNSLLTKANTDLAGARSQLAATKGVEWHLLALHFASEALMVANGTGEVVYANLQAERLFGGDPGALVGRAVCDLTDVLQRDRRRELIEGFMRGETPPRLAMGVQEPRYAQLEEGDVFRVTVVLERFRTHSKTMAVITVKEFLGDVEEIVRSLRKPIALLS